MHSPQVQSPQGATIKGKTKFNIRLRRAFTSFFTQMEKNSTFWRIAIAVSGASFRIPLSRPFVTISLRLFNDFIVFINISTPFPFETSGVP